MLYVLGWRNLARMLETGKTKVITTTIVGKSSKVWLFVHAPDSIWFM